MSARLLSAQAGRVGLPWLLLAATIPQGAPALRSTAPAPLTRSQESELWIAPTDIDRRDLFFGAGGPNLAPREGATFRYVALDRTGFSGGYDVADASGRRWSVKQGPEAQREVAASRLLWARRSARAGASHGARGTTWRASRASSSSLASGTVACSSTITVVTASCWPT